MVEDTGRHRPHCRTCTCATGGVIRWRPIVVVLVLVAVWDTVGLMFGDVFYQSRSYDVLREFAEMFSFAGHTPGMRIYAYGLAALVVPLTWALLTQRRRNGRTSRMLAFTLSGLAGWWAAWLAAIALTYIEQGTVYAWGSLGKLAGISAVAIIAARVPPPPSPTPGGDPCGH